jgi:hypothetical protein
VQQRRTGCTSPRERRRNCTHLQAGEHQPRQSGMGFTSVAAAHVILGKVQPGTTEQKLSLSRDNEQ